jgi:O-antigen ligase
MTRFASTIPLARPGGLVALLGLQATIAVVSVFDPWAAVALVVALAIGVIAIERPLVGLGLLLAVRLLSTGATVFFRVGRAGIGPYEPLLVLCIAGLGVSATFHRTPLFPDWAWRTPFLLLLAWMALSLCWSSDPRDGLSEILPLLLVWATTTLVLTFVRTWEDLRALVLVWLAASVLMAVVALLAGQHVLPTALSFEAAARGGRETGLGQQPNWFAMNLMFVIPTAIGLAIGARSMLAKLALLLSGGIVLFAMLSSGSRGAVVACVIAAVIPALAHARFRRWSWRAAVVSLAIAAATLRFDLGGSARALARIVSSTTIQQYYRPQNWWACWEMARDSLGLGIGAGGYRVELARHNAKLASTIYDYPHGIGWGVLAHEGIVGVFLFAWLVIAIARMAIVSARRAAGTEAEVLAWTMPAAMAGYFAWSFVEFSLWDKPFWEWAALTTALAAVVERRIRP